MVGTVIIVQMLIKRFGMPKIIEIVNAKNQPIYYMKLTQMHAHTGTHIYEQISTKRANAHIHICRHTHTNTHTYARKCWQSMHAKTTITRQSKSHLKV